MSRIDRADIDIAASASAVFAAFRDGAAYIAWLPPAGMRGSVLEWEFRSGGRYAFMLEHLDDVAGKSGGSRDISRGVFVDVIDGVGFAQTVQFDTAEAAFRGTMRISWSFVEAAGSTHVEVAASDVPAGITAADHAIGLRSTLDNLKRYVECQAAG